MKLLIILLGLASMACAYSDRRVDTIISSATYGYVDGAVRRTLALYTDNRSDLIQEAIDGFFQNSVKNFFNYAYKLNQNNSLIVQQYFPDAVRRILDGKLVNLVNKQHGHALKLSSTTDWQGNRNAIGEESVAGTYAWMFSPIWDDDDLTFHILGTEHNQYLKLSLDAGLLDERIAYSGDTPTENRYKWYLVPASSEGKNLFYIVNRAYNQALKFGQNRKKNLVAYAQNVDYHDPENLGWILNEYK